MSRLLRALAYVAPATALRRLAALDAIRAYDGATAGRRASSFVRGDGTANNEISRALPALRERSRELVRNTSIGARALDILTAHVVGTDMTVRFDTGSDALDRRAQQLFDDWAPRADIEGETNFVGVISLAFRAAMEGGDSIIRLRDLGSDSEGRAIPLAMHVGEGDLIDLSRDSGAVAAGGSRSRLGVELGRDDRRVGYWLHPAAPGEPSAALSAQSALEPRENVCHIYRRQRPGQVRGVPMFAPVLMATRDYADLIDALVVKERAQAAISLIVKSSDHTASVGAAVANGSSAAEALERIRPGTITRLRPGEDALAFAPAGNTAFEPLAITTLMSIAAGVGLTYDQLTGDLRQANYSSLRAGKVEFRRFVAEMQWQMLVPQVLDRVLDRFVDRAILAGRLRPRAEGYRRQYVMPAHEPIDPKKDLEADILAVRAGRMSPQDFIGAWGRDWREVVRESSEFFAAIDAAGLTYDIDGRHRTRVGADATDPSAPQPQDTAA